MTQGNDGERALMGELSAETLQFRGVRGYTVDGGCHDTAFIRRIGFPVFCDKATPRDIVGAWVLVAYDEPISFGQVVVRPGDFVLADCDGIVAGRTRAGRRRKERPVRGRLRPAASPPCRCAPT